MTTPFNKLLVGDCREDMARFGPFDMVIADPPYGDTSLKWDQLCEGWVAAAAGMLKPTGSMWVFGSMRFFQRQGHLFGEHGFNLAQDIVWEKHNGSSFHADRFRRVHEHVCHYYRAGARWAEVYNDVQYTLDAVARSVRRKKRPPHMGGIGEGHYVSEDGGPRIARSVVFCRSVHGRAIHPTEKPVDLLITIIKTSCPENGVVADLFAGSGAAGEAALLCGRKYIGIEIDKEMAEKAEARLDQVARLLRVAEGVI